MVELRAEDDTAFRNFMRMPPPMFDELLNRLQDRLTKEETNMREPIAPGLKLALTLRHLASGNKYTSMQYGWRVPDNSISVIVREVCQAILDEYLDECMTCPSTPDGWRAVAEKFNSRWNFPHTCGAIDGKHVACRAPWNSGSDYYNYKGFYSIILLAVVDADYKFLWADVGGLGSNSDAQIFNSSELKQSLQDGTIGFPDADPLPGDNQDVPYYFVGDDAFALQTFMMKPHSLRGMTREQRIFNYRLSRARRVVENAFGILANRFQVLMTSMQQGPETVKLIVKTCLVLHNLMRMRYPAMQNQQLDRPEGPNREQVELGAWRNDRNMLDTITENAATRASREAKMLRNLLTHWVNSPAGSVTWQDRMI